MSGVKRGKSGDNLKRLPITMKKWSLACRVLIINNGTLPQDMACTAEIIYGFMEGVEAIGLFADRPWLPIGELLSSGCGLMERVAS